MAHLFRQIYADEVDLEEVLTQSELIDLIFVEFIRQKITELKALEQCASQVDVWSTYRHNDEVLVEEDLWLQFADQVVDMVDREYIWNGIVEAFKIVKFPEPSTECRSYFEQLYCVSSIGLSTMYMQLKRPKGFENLIDYVKCVSKLKHQSTV